VRRGSVQGKGKRDEFHEVRERPFQEKSRHEGGKSKRKGIAVKRTRYDEARTRGQRNCAGEELSGIWTMHLDSLAEMGNCFTSQG